MNFTWFEGVAVVGLVLILIEVYNIRKEAPNRYRIMRPMIEDWYERNAGKCIPCEDEE